MKAESESNKGWQCPFQEKTIKEIYPHYDHQKFMHWIQKPLINYSLGCMFGSFIGDSLGSYLQFANNINEELINQAMKMREGGPFCIRAGQVTDDSEMSFHLLEGLSGYDPVKPLQSQRPDLIRQIAKGYIAWRKSKPFDIGMTCRSGIKILEEEINQSWFGSSPQKQMERVRTRLKEVNSKSQSNGSLMRITPLVFFASIAKEKYQEIQKLVEDQVQLIHQSEVIVKSSGQWVKTLLTLCWRKSNETLEKSYLGGLSTAKKFSKEWVEEIDAQQPMNAKLHQGWAKIAWSYGMRELKNAVKMYKENKEYPFDQFYFKNVMQRILQRGGDTDTNAAIVGGMVGSIVGFRNLPSDYLKSLFQLDFKDKTKAMLHDRPQFYEPRYAFVQIYQLLEKIHENKEEKHKHPKM